MFERLRNSFAPGGSLAALGHRYVVPAGALVVGGVASVALVATGIGGLGLGLAAFTGVIVVTDVADTPIRNIVSGVNQLSRKFGQWMRARTESVTRFLGEVAESLIGPGRHETLPIDWSPGGIRSGLERGRYFSDDFPKAKLADYVRLGGAAMRKLGGGPVGRQVLFDHIEALAGKQPPQLIDIVMQKLVEEGLVRELPKAGGGVEAYEITVAGEAELASSAFVAPDGPGLSGPGFGVKD